MPKPKTTSTAPSKSFESWIWDTACSIRGAKDAPKYKDYILPLIFTKSLCDVFNDELNRIAAEVGSRKKAFQLAKADHTAPCGSAIPKSEALRRHAQRKTTELQRRPPPRPRCIRAARLVRHPQARRPDRRRRHHRPS